ncbi:MAG: sugar phosphate isomerase/epimerase [Propionibacteriaceae bacterium]|jgi:sugar phosphate isomerase/epimerase|nr:sugar phosphate isomerase/epimerase [Propionibacteriaceae bacterium]
MSRDRLSLNTATCKHLTLAECVEVAKAAGLGAVGPWRDRVAEVGAAEAARIIHDAGLRVSTLCRGGFLTARDDAAAEAALADNRAAIDEAATLGTKELVFVVGGLPSGFAGMGIDHTPADDEDKDLVAARQRVADRVGILAPYARERGVRIALEPMHPLFTADRGVLTTIAQSLAIATDHPADVVGVVVDTYHVWWDPDLEASIAQAGAEGRISSYQICDWTLPLAANTLNSRGYPGDGHIDFPTISRWVAEAGYDGDVEVEIFNEEIWSRPGAEVVETIARRYEELVKPFL